MTPITTDVIEHNGHVISGVLKQDIFKAIKKRPVKGYTSAEIEFESSLDHGKVSGALSMLHKEGVLALLQEKRDGFRIYVLSDFVNGRPTKARKA